MTNKEIQIARQSIADGKARRSSSGSSTARSSFPIPDAPEHHSQLVDMCVLFQGLEWTQSMTEDLEKEYHIWLKEEKDTTANRRKFASEHLGNTGRSCATKIDMENFYPGTMHCAIRSSETIARKTMELIDILSLSKQKWLKCIAKVCQKDPQSSEMIRFSEKGVLLFCKHSPNFLKETGLVGVYLTILENFFAGLEKVFEWLLNTPCSLTGCEFDLYAQCLLGFQYAQIFGADSVTPSIKQIVSYMEYYIDKAKSDGELVGLPLSLKNFSDLIMETGHKETKGGLVQCSGGRNGKVDQVEYQKLLLAQQMSNNLLRIKTREENPCTSSIKRFKRKNNPENVEGDGISNKKKKNFDSSCVSI